MKNIKISYSYDGSDFYGFQRQPDKRTVQGEIEKVLNIILKKEITLTTAGRTDRGVHARVQVSNFFIDSSLTIPMENLKRAMNKLLPHDIDVFHVCEADMDFNARYMPKIRAYEYIITWKKDVFSRRYKTYIPKSVNPEELKKLLSVLVGKHDFNNFRIKDENNRTTVRDIYKIDVYYKNESRDEIGIYIEGSAFLKTQVRIIVGTALDVYFGRKPQNYLELLLNEPHVQRKIEVAEPGGLYLTKIEY